MQFGEIRCERVRKNLVWILKFPCFLGISIENFITSITTKKTYSFKKQRFLFKTTPKMIEGNLLEIYTPYPRTIWITKESSLFQFDPLLIGVLNQSLLWLPSNLRKQILERKEEIFIEFGGQKTLKSLLDLRAAPSLLHPPFLEEEVSPVI